MAGSKYVGITIGPIVKTIKNAKKTGQLWGASAIFSYIAKSLIVRLREKNLVEDFILPYVDTEVLNSNKGVGFPDRIIFKARGNAFDQLQTITTEVLDEIADGISKGLQMEGEGENKKLRDYVHNYFQIYYVEVELAENANPIMEISPYLDQLELHEAIIPCETRNYLMEFLKNGNVKDSFLPEKIFGEKLDKIKSLPEIASVEVSGLDNYSEIREEIKEIDPNSEKYYDQFYKLLDDKEVLKKYYKYIAIVQADGDNVGKMVAKLEGTLFDDFSKKLLDFSGEARELVMQYGGDLIYAGGDDLLFFAPVFNEFSEAVISDKKKIVNIFDLLDGLSAKFDGQLVGFKKELQDDLAKKDPSFKPDELPDPSLSLGLTISYNKFPLYEALEHAQALLFGKAKKFKLGKKAKNAIAFRLIKHSGQMTGTTVGKNSDSYRSFKQILEKVYQPGIEGGKDGKEVETNFLNSIIYHLKRDQKLLVNILKTGDWALNNYFVNNFKNHEKYQEILADIKDLILATYHDREWQDVQEEDSKLDDLFDQIHSFLKFIKFLNEEGNES